MKGRRPSKKLAGQAQALQILARLSLFPTLLPGSDEIKGIIPLEEFEIPGSDERKGIIPLEEFEI